VIEKSEKIMPEISVLYPGSSGKNLLQKMVRFISPVWQEELILLLKLKLPGIELSVHDRALNGNTHI